MAGQFFGTRLQKICHRRREIHAAAFCQDGQPPNAFANFCRQNLFLYTWPASFFRHNLAADQSGIGKKSQGIFFLFFLSLGKFYFLKELLRLR